MKSGTCFRCKGDIEEPIQVPPIMYANHPIRIPLPEIDVDDGVPTHPDVMVKLKDHDFHWECLAWLMKQVNEEIVS